MVNAVEIERSVRIARHARAARMHEVVVEDPVVGDGYGHGRIWGWIGRVQNAECNLQQRCEDGEGLFHPWTQCQPPELEQGEFLLGECAPIVPAANSKCHHPVTVDDLDRSRHTPEPATQISTRLAPTAADIFWATSWPK